MKGESRNTAELTKKRVLDFLNNAVKGLEEFPKGRGLDYVRDEILKAARLIIGKEGNGHSKLGNDL